MTNLTRRDARSLTFILVLMLAGSAFAEIPESSIHYSIEIELDPETRDLAGKATIEWTNTLDEPVASLPMHLYLNAFSNEASTWQRYTLGSRFLLSSIIERFPDPWGWTEPTLIKQGDAELSWQPIAPDDGNHLDRTLIEVQLDEPIAPGETVTLQVEWDGRLPAAAARTGGYGDFFFAAQWFPKIAGVKPEGEFNRHQFFGATEFFANFADYDVHIGVPKGWAIASTGKGELVTTQEGVDWHRYQQKGVVDFAWATGAEMVNIVTEHELATGGKVDIHVFQPKGFDHQVPRWVDATAVSLDTLSTRIYPYPYGTVTVVLPPMEGLRTLGMEYPTFFTGGPGGRIWDESPLKTTHINEGVIAHEFTHQYFMGIMATNEFEDAFMDEGMTEYWTAEIMTDKWGEQAGMGYLFDRAIHATSSGMRARPRETRQPAVWSGPSFLARGYSIGYQFYDRPMNTMLTAARLFGQDTVDAIYKRYANRWAFKHPRVEDFWAVAEEVAGAEVAAMLREAYLHPETPDYKVALLNVSQYKTPRGYVYASDEVTHVDSDFDGEELFALSQDAAETNGQVMLEILDPGHTRDVRVMGGFERRLIEPANDDADANFARSSSDYFVSTARVEGPGWDHLPVTVQLRFADGVVVEDEWDGKAIYREYRVVRRAPLSSVVVDPEQKIRLDIVPVNNGRSKDPEGEVATSWSRWMMGVYQLIAEGASSWL
ncbi:MAG: M1 family metallopeptidase [Woeseiaceae bacterium]